MTLYSDTWNITVNRRVCVSHQKLPPHVNRRCYFHHRCCYSFLLIVLLLCELLLFHLHLIHSSIASLWLTVVTVFFFIVSLLECWSLHLLPLTSESFSLSFLSPWLLLLPLISIFKSAFLPCIPQRIYFCLNIAHTFLSTFFYSFVSLCVCVFICPCWCNLHDTSASKSDGTEINLINWIDSFH